MKQGTSLGNTNYVLGAAATMTMFSLCLKTASLYTVAMTVDQGLIQSLVYRTVTGEHI